MEDTIEKEEMSVTGHGNPSLDADPITEDDEQLIDNALDEAFAETEGVEIPEAAEESTESEAESPAEPVAAPDTQQIEVEPVVPQAEIDPEIGKIEPPRNLSEKNQSNWRKLQETASVYKKQAQEAESLRQKLVEYEQKPPAPADYDDLRKFRAVFDIQSDPDFQSKYDVPINQAKTNLYSIMKQHGASDDLLRSIENAGGPDKIDQKWWQETLNKLPMTDAERVKRNIVDVADLSDRRQGEILNSAANAEQYYASRDEALVERFNRQEEESISYIREKAKEQKAEWSMYKEIPAGATPEQRKSTESHNAQVAQLEQHFMGAMYPQTPQARADVAAAAAMSHILTNQLRTEQSTRQQQEVKIKQLMDENNRLKGAGRMPRQNLGTSANNRPASATDRLKMSSADAIDMGLDEAGN